jgi:hypothetical protein
MTITAPAMMKNNFPTNPATSLKIMDIAIDLESLNGSSEFCRCMRNAVLAGKVKEAIKEIYEQSVSNRDVVSDMVGEKTLRKIEALCSNLYS